MYGKENITEGYRCQEQMTEGQAHCVACSNCHARVKLVTAEVFVGPKVNNVHADDSSITLTTTSDPILVDDTREDAY